MLYKNQYCSWHKLDLKMLTPLSRTRSGLSIYHIPVRCISYAQEPCWHQVTFFHVTIRSSSREKKKKKHDIEPLNNLYEDDVHDIYFLVWCVKKTRHDMGSSRARVQPEAPVWAKRFIARPVNQRLLKAIYMSDEAPSIYMRAKEGHTYVRGKHEISR